MAKLGLAIHEFGRERRRQAWLYIMANLANRPNGTIYVGVTNDLARRAWEHRTGAVPGFTKRYGLKRLVYARAARNNAKRHSSEKRTSRVGREPGAFGS